MAIKIQIKPVYKFLRYISAFLLFFWASLISCSFNALAQINVTGLFQNYNAVELTDNFELIAARNRFRVQLNRSMDFGRLYAEMDLIQRYDESPGIEILPRELYVDWYRRNYDIRVGQQTITWGRADGGFVTDILSPVDLRDFLAQDPADLRLGITALSIERYFGSNSFQIVLNPVFQPFLLPDEDSRWFPVQEIDTPFAIQFNKYERDWSIKDSQIGIQYRLRSVSKLDLDIMLLRWHHPIPAYAIEFQPFNFFDGPGFIFTETYQPSLMAGFSGTYQIHSDLLLTAETLFVKDKLFTSLPVPTSLIDEAFENLPALLELLQNIQFDGNGFLTEKPWLNTLVGLQTEWHGTTISFQAYLEKIINYDDQIVSQQTYPYITFLAVRSFLRERLQLFSLSRYNVDAEDYLLQISGNYEIADGFEFALGFNVFGGQSAPPYYGHLSYSRFSENSFIFSRVAFYF